MARTLKVEAIHAATGMPFVEIERKRVAEAAVDRPPNREGGAAEEIL